MCSRETLQNVQSGTHIRSPVRTEPRRNSIPPTQTLTAKHLLAYLPRPQPQSVRYTPYTCKVLTSCLCHSEWCHLVSEVCLCWEMCLLVNPPHGCLSVTVQNDGCAVWNQERVSHSSASFVLTLNLNFTSLWHDSCWEPPVVVQHETCTDVRWTNQPPVHVRWWL